MTLVWDKFPGAGSELLAMLAMGDWCNDLGGSLYPSMKAVADKIRVSEKQARRIVQGLEKGGWLTVVGNCYGGAPGTTKQFKLNVEKLKNLADLNAQTPPASVTPPMYVTPPTDGSRTPPTGVRDPSHPCPETPPTGGSQSTIDPSIDPPEGESAGAQDGFAPSAGADFSQAGFVESGTGAKAPARPSMATAVCIALKSIGMAGVNPGNEKLQILLRSGADIGDFVAVGRTCVETGKPFAYLLATVAGKMKDAAALAQTAMAAPQQAAGRHQAAPNKHAGAVAAIWGASGDNNDDGRTFNA